MTTSAVTTGGLSAAPPERSVVRGAPRDKLCVYLVVSLRYRLDRAVAGLVARPGALPGAGRIRSRNDLITLACQRLCAEHDTGALRRGTRPPIQPAQPVADGEPARRGPPRPAYLLPWESAVTAARCQLTVRVPAPLAARLRTLLTELVDLPRDAAAAPPDTATGELDGVSSLSDLIALACHRTCLAVEATTRTTHRRGHPRQRAAVTSPPIFAGR